MSVPAQKPGKSKQDYETPWAFLRAVQRRFGEVTLDLAAHAANHKCARWLGPGGLAEDALEVDWLSYLGGQDGHGYCQGLGWLNPPYADIKPWARKCRDESRRGARVLMLVPNGCGSDWFREYVHGEACVLSINGRLTFVGETLGYPKDQILVCWGIGVAGFDVWDLAPEERRDR